MSCRQSLSTERHSRFSPAARDHVKLSGIPYTVEQNYGYLRGMIQVRLLVCGCLEIDFLCCMLYASPLPPKFSGRDWKKSLAAICLYCFLAVPLLFFFLLDETKQSPSFKETEKTVYFFGPPQCVLYPIHKDICLLFLKIAPLNFLSSRLGSDSINTVITPPPTHTHTHTHPPAATQVQWQWRTSTVTYCGMPCFLGLQRADSFNMINACLFQTA
jgi:hypothetical protein